MDYVDMGYYDEIMKAKIYPKIVYYYLKKQILFKEYLYVILGASLYCTYFLCTVKLIY